MHTARNLKTVQQTLSNDEQCKLRIIFCATQDNGDKLYLYGTNLSQNIMWHRHNAWNASYSTWGVFIDRLNSQIVRLTSHYMKQYIASNTKATEQYSRQATTLSNTISVVYWIRQWKGYVASYRLSNSKSSTIDRGKTSNGKAKLSTLAARYS